MTEQDQQTPEQKLEERIRKQVTNATSPTVADQKALQEMLMGGPLCRILHQILVESDNKLTQVGTSDLTNDLMIKKSIKVQGEAVGLSRAVEYFIDFATTKFEETEQ